MAVSLGWEKKIYLAYGYVEELWLIYIMSK